MNITPKVFVSTPVVQQIVPPPPPPTVLLALRQDRHYGAILQVVDKDGNPVAGGCLAAVGFDGKLRVFRGVYSDIPVTKGYENRIEVNLE